LTVRAEVVNNGRDQQPPKTEWNAERFGLYAKAKFETAVKTYPPLYGTISVEASFVAGRFVGVAFNYRETLK
jgi:hypothetical protein